ncbi:hypothetical protein TruAng_008995 [Truncatella angustata]|nr:hypothetical protein TruAng_008995 [Truncatella angustata]
MAFYQFSRLPVEIRILIWKSALKATAIELGALTPSGRPPLSSKIWYRLGDGRNHAVPQINHEARQVAFETCKLQPFPVSLISGGPSVHFRVTIYVNWNEDIFLIEQFHLGFHEDVFRVSPAPATKSGLPFKRLALSFSYTPNSSLLDQSMTHGYDRAMFYWFGIYFVPGNITPPGIASSKLKLKEYIILGKHANCEPVGSGCRFAGSEEQCEQEKTYVEKLRETFNFADERGIQYYYPGEGPFHRHVQEKDWKMFER